MKKNIHFILLVLSCFFGIAQTNIAVDCAVGPETINYCYIDNDTTVYTFTSTDGSSLNFTINSGQVENNWDELLVFDSDGTTNLNAANPYGNSGDVSGISFQSSGDTISFTVQSDGSVNCQSSNFTPINVTVSCATCTNASASYAVISNCVVGPEFFIDTTITNLGSASALTVQDNQGNMQTDISVTGVVRLGPYTNNTNVVITVLNQDDANCEITSTALSQAICLDNVVDCASTGLDFNYCYSANDTNVFTFTSSTGFPVKITFNSGSVEENWDEFIVYDTDGTPLVPANYYGNGGDLTGLTYTSTGDTLSFQITSDGSVSCDSSAAITPINATLICQTCITPTVAFTAVGDCFTDPSNPEFSIDIDITDLGTVSSIQVADDQGSPGQIPTTTGVLTFGPYPVGIPVIIEVSTDDINCVVTSDALDFLCPLPPNECSMIFAGPDQFLLCAETSADLQANFQVTGQDTNSYEINALSSCPTPPVGVGDPTGLEIDDRWSEVIDLGFDFCFFGDTYSQLLVGANGALSFDLGVAGDSSGWSFSETIPNNTTQALRDANIFIAYHDIDPSNCGDINFSVVGNAPNRQFVVNYNDVCQFSCGTQLASMQAILYEGSNNIDINVFNKPACAWNGGSSVIGVQNMDGDVAFTPAGRNTGNWSATNEFYRFSPGQSATPNYTFEWYDSNGIFIGSTPDLTVSLTETSTYTATITYGQCAGPNITITDEVTIEFEPLDDSSFTVTPTCDGATVVIDGDTGGTFAFNPLPTDAALIDAITGDVTDATPGATYTIEYSINPTDPCGSITQEILIVIPAIILQTVTPLEICDDNGDGFSEFDLTFVEAQLLNGLSGVMVTYHETLADAEDNLNPFISPTLYTSMSNVQTIYIRVEDMTTSCFNTQTVDLITNDLPEFTLDTTTAFEVCPNATTPITVSVVATNFIAQDVTIEWEFNGVIIDDEVNLSLDSVLIAGEYIITVTDNLTSCTSTETIMVTELVSCVVPQGISPNNDGLNDNFDLSSYDVQSLEVFNRNGRKVFVKNDGYTNEWFGQSEGGDELPTGTYYYIMRYRGNQVKASYVYINR